MTNSPTIVLLGGGGLGPWVWERVTPLIESRGLRTLTPQLRATGDDTTPPSQVTLADWIDDVTAFLTEHDKPDVALVAHSFAGYVAAGVLARGTPGLTSVVFLDAVKPRPGRSWFDVMGPDVEQFMSGLAVDGAIPFLTREQLDQVYPAHGISDADWEWMESQVTPQPLGTCTQPAISEPLDPTLKPLAYVRCVRTTPPASEIDASTPGWTFGTIDSGHWPMITNPEATADAIAKLAIQ